MLFTLRQRLRFVDDSVTDLVGNKDCATAEQTLSLWLDQLFNGLNSKPLTERGSGIGSVSKSVEEVGRDC